MVSFDRIMERGRERNYGEKRTTRVGGILMSMKEKAGLTSSEISVLWLDYQQKTLASCFFRYFLEKAEDEEVRVALESGYAKCCKQLAELQTIYRNNSLPFPIGFGEGDVDVTAPRLFSDAFALSFLYNVSEAATAMLSTFFVRVVRPDVRRYFHLCAQDAMECFEFTVDLMLAKGLLVRAPYITPPEKSEILHKQTFLTGFFGRRRPLTAQEVSGLFTNMQRNVYGRVIITGFAQVAKNKDAREYLWRGVEISTKHIKEFSSLLLDNDMPASMPSDGNVTESRVAPFSDRLMMSMIATLNGYSLNNYAGAVAGSPRRDLGAMYVRLSAEIAAYAEDGAEVTIEHGWLEQPPQADNRRELVGV